MKKQHLTEWIIGAITLFPFVYLAWIWGQLPDQVPVHFNIEGQADRYSSKAGLLLPVSLVTVMTWALLKFLPNIDPRGKITRENPAVFRNLRLICAIFTSALAIMIIHAAHSNGGGINFLPFIIGAFFAGLGNYLINIKPNYFIGIRTPWTLESEQVWRKTHRVGGKMMFWGGIAIALSTFLSPPSLVIGIMLGIILLISLVPMVLSYRYFQQEKQQ